VEGWMDGWMAMNEDVIPGGKWKYGRRLFIPFK
jgi:hypothetical protein